MCIVIFRILLLVAILYFFICSLALLSDAFTLLGGGTWHCDVTGTCVTSLMLMLSFQGERPAARFAVRCFRTRCVASS